MMRSDWFKLVTLIATSNQNALFHKRSYNMNMASDLGT